MPRKDIAKDGKKTQFSTKNQPAKRGRPEGIPNRATVFQLILEKKVDVTDPETGQKLKVSLYEAAALGQIKAAMNGNTNAWKEIQDTLHGKLTDKKELTIEGPIPITIIEPVKPDA